MTDIQDVISPKLANAIANPIFLQWTVYCAQVAISAQIN